MEDLTQTDQPQPLSTLGAMAGGVQAPPIDQVAPQGPAPNISGPVAMPTKPPTSRLQAILGAVANVAATGLQGIPDKGRPSFVTGLGEGARAEKQAELQQQAVKFRDMDTQIRLAELHHQDVKMQNDTQAQKDAHIQAELHMRSLANDLGVDYETIANHGTAVMDNLTAQTAGTGSASVPAGTHVSGDGQNIYVPKDPDSDKTREGQKQLYNTLAPALGLPSLPAGAQFVPPKQMNMLTNKINGFGLDGSPIKHDDLPGMLGAAQAQRNSLAKNGGTPQQLKVLDNMIGIYKANLDSLDEHAAGVKTKNKEAEIAAENSPEAISGAARKAAAVAKAKFPYELELAKQKAAQKADNTNLDSVAFDPNYPNSDGTKGANVVMAASDAKTKGLTHYKANPDTINTVVAGMNDVQNKLNQLAEVVTDPKQFGQVEPAKAAQMLAYGHGLSLQYGAKGASLGIDTSAINEKAYQGVVKLANQATRDYVTAMVGAHEAVTQLPRLQTFGKSNRMTEKQMEAAQNLLPHPGDGEMAAQKMHSLQGMLDPLRKQIPHMPGAESTPSWLEQRQQQQRQSGGSNLGQAVMGNPTDLINSLGLGSFRNKN